MWAVTLASTLSFTSPPALAADFVQLSTPEGHTFEIDPTTLEATLTSPDGKGVGVSASVAGLGPLRDLTADGASASWELPQVGLSVHIKLQAERLHVALRSDGQRSLTWPVVQPMPELHGFVVPAFEGVYVGATDPVLTRWLHEQGEMSATEHLSMPFIGLDLGDRTLTYILPIPHYVTVAFGAEAPPEASFTHTWTRMRTGAEYSVVIELGDPGPLVPALAYRRWLAENGELLTLREKIIATPAVERLLGAPHAYVWDAGYLSRHDIPRNRWRAFASALRQVADGDAQSFAARLLARLSDEGREAIQAISGAEYPDRYNTGVAASAISEALLDPALSGLPPDTPRADVARTNGEALAAAFPESFGDPERWGNGVSVALLDAMQEAGLDRMALFTGDLDMAALKPHVAARASELGYLFGPYDSYHSVHSPDADPDDTWATAQFDPELYQAGRIIGEDGTPLAGFKQRGYLLSPAAARPYVEQRVNGLLAALPFTAWFVDCDAYGQFFDDYHPDHQATRLEDTEARRERLRWLSEEHSLVVGSEGGSAVMTPAFHFGHGVMTPVIGWGDARLNERESEYFLGGYWPPDEPAVFFKAAKLPADYEHPYFSSVDRVPLYQAVFGDCVITTHHWSFASLKTLDHVETVELLELLYNVPPLYHLNRDRWAQDEARIVRHFAFWSPLHRQLATAPLTGFDHLTADRLVQRTTFSLDQGEVQLVANFSEVERRIADGQTLPARSVTVIGPIEIDQRVFVVEANLDQ